MSTRDFNLWLFALISVSVAFGGVRPGLAWRSLFTFWPMKQLSVGQLAWSNSFWAFWSFCNPPVVDENLWWPSDAATSEFQSFGHPVKVPTRNPCGVYCQQTKLAPAQMIARIEPFQWISSQWALPVKPARYRANSKAAAEKASL